MVRSNGSCPKLGFFDRQSTTPSLRSMASQVFRMVKIVCFSRFGFGFRFQMWKWKCTISQIGLLVVLENFLKSFCFSWACRLPINGVMSAALNRICGATRPTSIWREALAGKIVGLFDHTAQNRMISNLRTDCELKMFPCQTALQGQNGKKKLSRCFKSQRPKECLDIGHLRYPMISPIQNLPLKCFQTNHLQGNVLHFKQKQTKTQWKSKWIVLIPKTCSNMKMLFLAPLLTAWSPSHLFSADHFGHLSCHNYAPWTRSANCRLCSAAAFDVVDVWSP